MCIALTVLAVFVVNHGLDYGRARAACINCGAHRQYRYFSLYGPGFEWSERLVEGPVSRLIQQHDGLKCLHQWQISDATYGNLFDRPRGTWSGLTRALRVNGLEGWPSLQVVLERRCKADAGFPASLKKAIQSPYESTSETLLDALAQEVTALDSGEEQADVVASQPSAIRR